MECKINELQTAIMQNHGGDIQHAMAVKPDPKTHLPSLPPLPSPPGLLGSPGLFLALLGSHGLSWAPLGSPGLTWVLLGSLVLS